MATKSRDRLNRQFDRLQRRVPDFAARLLERIRRPEARWFRIPLGLLLMLGGIFSFLPILVTGILYGLAMDYQVFLVSSMRESHVHGHVGQEAIKRGFEHASKVVVAAAVIMVAVFGGFAFNEDIMVKQIGVALSIGILLDAFLIRMALTPALLALFGERSWWIPRWLDRSLPNLDI